VEFLPFLTLTYVPYIIPSRHLKYILHRLSLTLVLSRADFLEIMETQIPGNLGACPGLSRDCFTILTFASMPTV
jgi:hypothetical protein